MKRISVIILIIILYLIPLYQNLLNKSPQKNKVVSEQYKEAPLDKSQPFYFEDFVNVEKPGSISHVSSISPTVGNRVACVWYAGSREGAKDVSIYFSVFDEEKAVWTEPIILIDRKRCSEELNRYVKKIGNPLILRDKRGRIWLFYASVFFGGWSGTSINYKFYQDGGYSWSKSRKMILSPFLNLTNNVKNKGINFDDGSFVIPVYHEFIKKFSQLLWVRPDGVSPDYEIQKMTTHMKAIQPSLLYNGDENLSAFFRNMGKEKKKHILTAYSNDLGQSWSELSDTTLPNPNSGFDMISLSDGAYLGAINNSFGDRSNLTLIISWDKGKTWKSIKVLEDRRGMEYSYPSITRSSRGFYHITYTYEKKRIKHITFNEAWIKQFE